MKQPTPSDPRTFDRRYAVFLSYRHADNKEQGRQWATWLHQVLEGYEVPADLVGTQSSVGEPIPASLYPVFRDEEELPADADLTRNIQQALERSALLVVICSPRAAESRFVAAEIRYFKELGKADRILALMIDGEPNVSDDAGKQKSGIAVEAECLPEPLRYGVAGEDGKIDWERRTEPIAADARPGGRPEQGWTTGAAYREALLKNADTNGQEIQLQVRDYEERLELAKLKVIAGSLGVPLGILTARDKAMQLRKARQRSRILRRWLAAVGILAVVALAVGIYAWRQKQNAQLAQSQAETEKSRAEDALFKTRAAMSQSDFLQATRSLEAGRIPDALAQLARSLSVNPRNEASLFRLTTLLAYRNFAVPLTYLKQEGPARAAQLPPDATVSQSAKSILGSRAEPWNAEKQAPAMHPMYKDDPDSVRFVTLSPDAKRLNIFTDYHLARVWDAETGEAIGEPFKYGDRGEEGAIYLSPDAKRAVNIGGQIRLWDTQTGKPITDLASASEESNVAEFSSDSKLLATGNGSDLSVWEAANGKPVKGPIHHSANIGVLRFSADAKRIATASQGIVQIWDTQNGTSSGASLIHNSDVGSVRFSLDGGLIATVTTDNTARVWSAESGKPITSPLSPDGETNNSLEFSRDGKHLLVASAKSVTVWDPLTGKKSLGPLLNPGSISSAQFSPEGRRIATASTDRTVRMWNTAGGSELIEPIMHPAEVRWAGFSSDGQRLVTLLSDVTGRVWEVRRGAALPTRLKHKSAVMAAEFTRDGNQVMTVAQDTTGGTSVQVWTAATGTLVVDPKRYDSAESLPEFSPDATRLLTRSDKGAQLWDVASGNKIGPLLAHDDFLMSAHFNSDGKQVVTASHDKTAKIWSAENGTLIGQPLVHEDKLMLALFSPDSKRIVTSTEGKKIRIWDVSTGASIAEWEYVTYINAAQFSPDGRRLVTWTMDDVTAHVWEVENGQASSSSLRHSAQVNAAEFSPDGKKIVTASDDRTARVWDAQTGKPLTDALEHGGEVTSAGFSPNGRQIVTVSRDNTVRIWDAESGKPIAEPFQCRDVASARFSPDGARLLLASQQSGAVLWDLVPAEKVAPKWLLSLAEITAGQRLDDNGVFQTLTSDPSQIRKEIESQLATVPKDGAWSTWGHWWLSDRGTRTISPFSRTKISEYIEMLIQDNTPASLDEAEEFAFGNREAYERIMRVRQNNGSEPGPTKRP